MDHLVDAESNATAKLTSSFLVVLVPPPPPGAMAAGVPVQNRPTQPHRATSCLLALPLAAGAMMTAAVGVVFLMEVRRMWEVLCR